MSHSFEELRVGARIRVREWEYEVEIVEKSPEKRLKVRGNGPVNTISYTRYVCTPGYRKSQGELHWMKCEQHYGEETPCPLAFKILKGDPQAPDAARDVLRC